MSGLGGRWLLLPGTPLTPEVWDGVAAYLRQSGPWMPSPRNRRRLRRLGKVLPGGTTPGTPAAPRTARHAAAVMHRFC